MAKIFIKFKVLMLLVTLMASGLLISDAILAQQSAKSKTFVVVGTAPVYKNNVAAARGGSDRPDGDGSERARGRAV